VLFAWPHISAPFHRPDADGITTTPGLLSSIVSPQSCDSFVFLAFFAVQNTNVQPTIPLSPQAPTPSPSFTT